MFSEKDYEYLTKGIAFRGWDRILVGSIIRKYNITFAAGGVMGI